MLNRQFRLNLALWLSDFLSIPNVLFPQFPPCHLIQIILLMFRPNMFNSSLFLTLHPTFKQWGTLLRTSDYIPNLILSLSIPVTALAQAIMPLRVRYWSSLLVGLPVLTLALLQSQYSIQSDPFGIISQIGHVFCWKSSSSDHFTLNNDRSHDKALMWSGLWFCLWLHSLLLVSSFAGSSHTVLLDILQTRSMLLQ